MGLEMELELEETHYLQLVSYLVSTTSTSLI